MLIGKKVISNKKSVINCSQPVLFICFYIFLLKDVYDLIRVDNNLSVFLSIKIKITTSVNINFKKDSQSIKLKVFQIIYPISDSAKIFLFKQ